jgi:hypothetical protein
MKNMNFTTYYDIVCKAMGIWKPEFDKQIRKAFLQKVEPNAAAWAIKTADRLK